MTCIPRQMKEYGKGRKGVTLGQTKCHKHLFGKPEGKKPL